ncbi:MAG TPA: BamA/TamA family outer membrane protein, partial [Longimicrobium sp.]|nr:BamA/TamA family outer membrane protein [Longimicrobium sp.]
LFDLELVEFAAVEVAPEHLQLTPDSLELDRDSIGSTVLVRVVEAARYAVDLAVGVGTRDCGRAQVSHLDRNFLGGARRLEISGLVAKLGVAGPVQGMEGTFLCDAFDPDRQLTEVDTLIADALNYRLAFNFVQPRLFGTQTSVVGGGFYERISELNLYLRDDFGGEVGVVRQIQNNTVASLTFNVQRGRTRASDYFFCIAYEVCTPQDIARLERTRWSNALTLGAVRSRVRVDPFPRTGYQARGQVDYASAALGSEDDYLRFYLDGIRHAELRKNMVLSVRLMGGTFLTGLLGNESGYIPPERRFYGGGPTGVRGFRFNELGPTVYISRPVRKPDGGIEVQTVASSTGGTRTVLGTAELTFPLVLPPEKFRAAVFVDAGQVWASQDQLASRPGIRVTPGVGGRFASPVGPIRVDVAYNPYPAERGPLYGINERGELLPDPLQLDFSENEHRGFLRRLVLQFSVGQAL